MNLTGCLSQSRIVVEGGRQPVTIGRGGGYKRFKRAEEKYRKQTIFTENQNRVI